MRERTNAGYICEISKERTDDPEVDTFDLKTFSFLSAVSVISPRLLPRKT